MSVNVVFINEISKGVGDRTEGSLLSGNVAVFLKLDVVFLNKISEGVDDKAECTSIFRIIACMSDSR